LFRLPLALPPSMNSPAPVDESLRLQADSLSWRCDPNLLDFVTTGELEELSEILGQARALDAIRFGMGMRRDGYNLYVLGPPGIGKRTIVEGIVSKKAAGEPTPSDWCYVHNFTDAAKPRALRIPPGRGVKLRQDLEAVVDDLRTVIPAALESDEHKSRIQEIEQRAKERHEESLRELADSALKEGLQLIRAPSGFALGPIRDGQVISPEDFDKLNVEEKRQIERTVDKFQIELKTVIEQVPKLRKEVGDRVKELNREAVRLAIGHLLSQVKEKYADLPHIVEYFDAVERDVIDFADAFRSPEETPNVFGMVMGEAPSFERYEVNDLVDHAGVEGAPVIVEDHPNYHNLLGRVEHRSHMGTLETDFTLIRAGALHKANGGYLLIDAYRLLAEPFAWEALKRALHARCVKIESLGEALSLISTVSLEPEPIPLDVKVILVGDRLLYYLLYQYDRDFADLFKVAADFEDEIGRTPESCLLYARLIASLARHEQCRPLDPSAVARVLERSARVAGDSERFTMRLRTLADLLRESDYWAGERNSDAITAAHVDLAIEKQIYRSDRIRQRVQEEIERDLVYIDTQGERVAQVNGLSVIDLGNFAFGRPSRITATARLGRGEVIDIEREVELGGSLHSKGVLILSSYLASRYARKQPLSLSASLVFEQSYGMVEGDSASVAELCAILSALAEAPIRQSLAVTGSVNQLGQVQPIGGVNEKIEGFFDVCRARGLSGEQGVLIPSANVKHLMLRRDVVEAAEAGRFHVYAIKTVDQAISLLTGIAAGQRDSSGNYPPGTINHRVETRLIELAQFRQAYAEQQLSQKRP
jgi:lon-related putative ATP-dependent protease